MAGHQSHELRKDSVGTLEVAALSFAGLAPTMAMALGTSFAAIQAGAAVPLAYVLGMFGSLALAYVIVVFTRRVAASACTGACATDVRSERFSARTRDSSRDGSMPVVGCLRRPWCWPSARCR